MQEEQHSLKEPQTHGFYITIKYGAHSPECKIQKIDKFLYKEHNKSWV